MSNISSDYLDKQKQLHQNDKYGAASVSFAPLIVDIMDSTGIRSVSDYGAGKCRLGQILKKNFKHLEYYPFDPAFPEYGPAREAELVTCIDVLEHIEPEYLDEVISELAKITTHIGFFSVHTGPAKKNLSDGRNAHLIQQPASWWLNKLIPYFDLIQLTPVKRGFWVVVQSKQTDYKQYFVKKPSYEKRLVKLARWFRGLFRRI